MDGAPRRTDSILAGLAGASAGLVYALTMCPTVHWYDSAEFSASAATLRVAPHPPGYPLYTLIGHLFTQLPGEAALGMNIMSATFGVLATVLIYVCARQIGVRPVAAFVASLLLATCPTLWGNAVKAEVYTPGLAFTLGALALVLESGRRGSVPLAWAAAGVAGLGLGVHMSIATLGVGYGVLVARLCFAREQDRWRIRTKRVVALVVGCAVAAGLGGAILLGVPLGLFEEITPLGTGGHHPEVMWTRGVDYLSGGVFRRYFHDFAALPRLLTIAEVYVANLTPPGVALGLLGLMIGGRRNRVVTAALVAGIIGNAAWFFRYDVPDLDVFLLPGLACLVLSAAMGLDFVAEQIDARRPGWGRFVLGVGLLMPTIAVARHWTELDLSDDYAAAEYGQRFCAAIPRGAILAMTSQPTEWELYTVALYMHETGRGCQSVVFWGFARPWRINEAFANGRTVYTFTDTPRFASSFEIVPRGPAYEVVVR